jgi:hypothetical protein
LSALRLKRLKLVLLPLNRMHPFFNVAGRGRRSRLATFINKLKASAPIDQRLAT